MKSKDCYEIENLEVILEWKTAHLPFPQFAALFCFIIKHPRGEWNFVWKICKIHGQR